MNLATGQLRCAAAVVICAIAAFPATAQKLVANSVSGSVEIGAEVRKDLRVQLNEADVALGSYRIGITFTDPRKANRVFDIVFDAAFLPSREVEDGTEVSDFFVETSIRPKGADEDITELAQCDWLSSDKTTAKCSVGEDGGGFVIRVEKRGAEARDTQLSLVIGDGLTSGFRVASTTECGAAADDFLLRAVQDQLVVVPIVIN